MSWRSTSSISPSISTPSPKNPGRFACRDNEKCALLRSPRGRGGSLASSRTTFTSSLLPSVASCLTAPMKPNSATGAVASASSAPQFEHARERDRGTLDRHSAPRMPRPSPAHRSAPSRCTARDATPTTSARACRRRQRQPPVDDRPCLCVVYLGRARQAGGSSRAEISPRYFLRSQMVWGRAVASCGRS
jgi:hypothetical protein